MMIPDCHRRIVAAHAELKQLLDTEVNRCLRDIRDIRDIMYISSKFSAIQSVLLD
jgi:hypothetical protein